MSDRALVIGVDAYKDPKWTLSAAVRDAVAFAKWVTAPGANRATSETLTLLLSPHPARPVADLNFEAASETAIRRALYDHKKNGAGAQRLWFFYAGHGIAPSGGGPDEAPLIVPADVTDLEYYRYNPIEIGTWIREMQICAPEYQMYFVDACRGVVVSEDAVTASKTLFFDLSKVKPDAQARQAVLFAATAGQLANEQGLHGLFGGALIDGLRGAGPVLEPDVEKEEFVLTFGQLSAYVKRRIQAQAEEARRASKTLPTQEPAESLFRVSGSLELDRFAEKPRSPVKVFVEPEDAKQFGTAGIRGYNDLKGVWERQEPRAAPLAVPIEWSLSSTVYKIEIEARGFENWSKKVEVVGPVEMRAALVPIMRPAFESAIIDFAPNGQEFTEPPHRIEVPLPSAPDGAELGRGKLGRLSVRAADRLARIEVFDTAGARVGAAWGSLVTTLPVGSFRVETALPTERPVVRRVLVTADEPVTVEIAPDPQLTQRLPAGVGVIMPHDGVSEPSEAFGVATTTHLGSLLAWAAFAAQFPANGNGNKLRALGVEPLPSGPGQCFVRVLVGDARTGLENAQPGLIESLVVEVDRQPVALTPLAALSGFAVQGHAPLLHAASLAVSGAGLDPRRIPLPYVAGHVWTIIIVREPTQSTEIHLYLQRLEPQAHFDDTIRLVEQNWRSLEARRPLYEGEAELLLARDLDPLSLAVLGYRLTLETRWPEVEDVLIRLGSAPLADVHVLAAGVIERDANMELAVTSPSVPVVGEGYRLMEAWLVDHFASRDMPPPLAPEPFNGGVWTTFDTRGGAVISRAFPVRNAPAWATPLLAAANATARIEAEPGKPFVGTGFLIGPRTLATVDFVTKQNPQIAEFDEKAVVIEQILGAPNDGRHAAVARIASTGLVPLTPRWTLPEVGTRIAVIGHPLITFTPTIATLAAFMTYPTGKKMIMPGIIVAVEETKLTYECWTMAGVAGGPILDLATGEVIGIHHSGKYQGGATKLGFGVPMKAIEDFVKLAI